MLVSFYLHFSLDHFAFFFLTSQVTFSRFRSSVLSDIYCSYSEVKLVVIINSVAAYQKVGPDRRVGSASGY